MDAVYPAVIDIINLYDLLQFDGASDVVNEENEKAGPTVISVVLTSPRKSSRTWLHHDPRTQREGAQGSSP